MVEHSRERRRHRRYVVALHACVRGRDGEALGVTVLDLSRGGALITGPVAMKSLMFEPKRYTHSAVPVVLELAAPDATCRRLLLGRCRYLQKLADGSYRAGFRFAQLQPLNWVQTVSALCERATPPEAPPGFRAHPRDCGPAPGG